MTWWSTGQGADGASHVRLIGEAGSGRDAGEGRTPSGNQREGALRPRLGAESGRRSVKYLCEAARHRRGREPVALGPLIEAQLRILEQVAREKIGPIGGAWLDRRQLLAKHPRGRGRINFRRSRNPIRILDETEPKHRFFVQQQIQDLRSLRLEAVDVRIERPVEQYLAGADAIATAAAALVIPAAQDYRRVGALMTVARNTGVSTPGIAAFDDGGEAAHCPLVRVHGR